MQDKKKVLIISASTGFGHIRAGEALLDYAKEHLSQIHAEHVDITNISPSLKKHERFYDLMSRKFPLVIWEILYKFPPVFYSVKVFFGFLGLFNNNIKNYILEKKPYVVIFTNGLVLTNVAFSYRDVFPNTKVAVMVTDYHGHPYYNFPFVDYYFVANDQVGKDLENTGIAREKITATGIPINPRFYIQQNVEDLKIKYGIANSFPVVLLITSFRVHKKALIKTIGQLLAFEPKINVIFIANGNEELFNIVKEEYQNAERFLMVNWTNLMEEYIKISDVVISKAGGLTVSECLALKKQMIIINPIPGQEEHNTAFMEKNNLGVRVKNIGEVATALARFISLQKNGIHKSNQKDVVPVKNPCKKIFDVLLEIKN